MIDDEVVWSSYEWFVLPGLSKASSTVFLFVSALMIHVCSSHHKALHVPAMVAYTFPLWSFTFWLWLSVVSSTFFKGSTCLFSNNRLRGCNTIGFTWRLLLGALPRWSCTFVAGGWFCAPSCILAMALPVDGRCLLPRCCMFCKTYCWINF